MDLAALRANLRALKALLPEETAVLAVIKSEAYGHGLLEVARVLSQEGVYGFGLSEPEEALRLRRAGLALPLFLLSGFEPDWLPEILRLRIIPALASLHMIEAAAEFSRRKGIALEVHLKMDTGMHRLGLTPEELPAALNLLRENPQLRVSGLMTHLACAEKPEDPLTREQLRLFHQLKNALSREFPSLRFFHAANSAGIIFLRGAGGNLVRPGISLYGGYPSFRARARVKLRPVMTLKARILEVKNIRAGEAVGYGPLYRAREPRRIAIVPVGYDDGYPRGLSNRGFAWLRGRRVPVVGAVSMRSLTLDVTEVEGEVKPGEEVILLGGAEERVPVDELAELAGTISYEIFCALGRRLVRIYRDV
nr:alanine racemase [Thermosulfurimonas sp. F29]